ncbi:hypothetical protein M3223_13800 [Paenibacillus pasadenensis]|uniref:hypothetical protein n=1 Tax=Paenibacillus pasadenensis TaxID=217090 RepID=UPI002040D185|nr:hypothetical protein [Paenibacillus pasadenensis]MCM3748420.1 hypothetical protein [Paenibacillus pasadenensis]
MTERNEAVEAEASAVQAENEAQEAEQPKKMSLAEAAKLKLQQKKQAQAVGKQGQGGAQGGAKELRSQLNKKPNNQRRRMGV